MDINDPYGVDIRTDMNGSEYLEYLGTFDFTIFSGPELVIFAKGFFVLGSLLLYWVNYAYLESFVSKIQSEQFIVLLAMLFFGCLFMSATHFIEVLVILTAFSVCSYILITQPKTLSAVEAGTKYFSLGLASVAFVFLGILLI